MEKIIVFQETGIVISKIESLTRRELEVLKMLSYGTYNKRNCRAFEYQRTYCEESCF